MLRKYNTLLWNIDIKGQFHHDHAMNKTKAQILTHKI